MGSSKQHHSSTDVFYPSQTFSKKACIGSMEEYQQLSEQARQAPEIFWGDLARNHLFWNKPFNQVLNTQQAPFYRWFEGGETNASYQCLDYQVLQGNGDKVALIYERDDGRVSQVTYTSLLEQVGRCANGLKSLGVSLGDRVVIYMPMSVEGIVAMLACARIGAVHSVVFGGFSAKSLAERIKDLGCRLIITADGQHRGGKVIPLKTVVDEALSNPVIQPNLTVLVVRHAGITCPWQAGRDRDWTVLMAQQNAACPVSWVESDHPLFVLYTSGSTGKPKGIQHSTAGYLLWSMITIQWVFDIRPDDIYWCTADIGWITGHSYVVYGPLGMGATVLIYEGVPSYPDAGRFWQMISRHRVSIFYTAPTAIRSLIKASEVSPETHPTHFDLSSLRILGSVGEPINPEVWKWFYREVGSSRCPVLDTFWQTETGGHVIAPLPGATPLVPGSCTLPLPGMDVGIVDETGQDVAQGLSGFLVIKSPWPSMVRTIWNDPERFVKTYFPKELGGQYYLAGDGAVQDPKTGYITITGRIDDVLNVSGHRLGTMEVESALVSNPLVAEAAVVGRPDELTGEAIVAYVVLKGQRPEGEQSEQMAKTLRDWVAQEIGPIAKPKEIRFGDNLPKTRSGKIMRRLLRSLAKGEEVSQDISTLENPQILEQLKGNH